MAPIGGGLALVEALAGWCEKAGAQFFYQTTARELVQNEAGAVTGVRGFTAPATDRSRSTAVRWCWPAAASRAIRKCSRTISGRAPATSARWRAAATTTRAKASAWRSPSARRPAATTAAFTPSRSIRAPARPNPWCWCSITASWSTRTAQRFVNEAPATVDATYEAITRIIFEQPDGIAYCILDAKIDDVPNWKRSVRSDQPPIAADSLAGTRRQSSASTRGDFAATVEAYNAACPTGTFKPLELDGLATRAGFAPRKTNWARTIDKPPFLAFPIICGNCFTFGGLKVDTARARAQRRRRRHSGALRRRRDHRTLLRHLCRRDLGAARRRVRAHRRRSRGGAKGAVIGSRRAAAKPLGLQASARPREGKLMHVRVLSVFYRRGCACGFGCGRIRRAAGDARRPSARKSSSARP